jgi:predicted amidohydrolase YtcJ
MEKVKEFIQAEKIKPGEWVQGRGWDQNDWEPGLPGGGKAGFPNNELLDKYFPANPVVLKRIDGHAIIANTRAIELAAIKPGQTLKGGLVETIQGKLTGIFIDNAQDLVIRSIPIPTKEQYKIALSDAQAKCFSMGLTSVQDCGLSKYAVDLVDTLQQEGILKMKLNILLSDDSANYAYYLKTGPFKTERLHVNGFKLYADGALGSRGACLLAPYSDQQDGQGFLLKDRDYFEKIIPMIYQSKFQACTHAIGDSGNRMILQVYAKVLQGKNDRRWRVEHAQVINASDFSLFGDYTIIPSVQPTHATSDMYWAANRLGNERMKGAYAYKDLLKQNGWMPLGTDFPVEDISPFKTFYAAVARQDAKGFPAGGFQMENALTREETLKGMTTWAAKAAFEEKEKGSLEIGMAADFIMLDTDLMNCPAYKILAAKTLYTYINGEKVFGK